MKKRTALIDADIAVYRIAAWAAADNIDALEARESVIGLIKDWARAARCQRIVACLSHWTEKSFRYQVLETYKHNRKNTAPPELRKLLFDVVQDEFKSVTVPNLEADDIMGILATCESCIPNPVIVTIDKDLMQIPGCHFNPMKHEDGALLTISEAQAEYTFHLQWLTGDSTDGYGGIYRFGIKGAQKLLAPFWNEDEYDAAGAEQAIVELYNERGYEYDYCVQMYRMARILRAEHWDAEKRVYRLAGPTVEYAK